MVCIQRTYFLVNKNKWGIKMCFPPSRCINWFSFDHPVLSLNNINFANLELLMADSNKVKQSGPRLHNLNILLTCFLNIPVHCNEP